MTAWQQFFAKINQACMLTLKEINEQIDMQNPDITTINSSLEAYYILLQKRWTELLANHNVRDLNNDLLQDIIPKLELSQDTKQILQQLDNTNPLKTAIYQKYDPSQDGMATIYTSWFVKTKATLRGERAWFADFYAWYNGCGILFPNLRALLKGHMTLSQYLFGATAQEIPVENATPQATDESISAVSNISFFKKSNPQVDNESMSNTSSVDISHAD